MFFGHPGLGLKESRVLPPTRWSDDQSIAIAADLNGLIGRQARQVHQGLVQHQRPAITYLCQSLFEHNPPRYYNVITPYEIATTRSTAGSGPPHQLPFQALQALEAGEEAGLDRQGFGGAQLDGLPFFQHQHPGAGLGDEDPVGRQHQGGPP